MFEIMSADEAIRLIRCVDLCPKPCPGLLSENRSDFLTGAYLAGAGASQPSDRPEGYNASSDSFFSLSMRTCLSFFDMRVFLFSLILDFLCLQSGHFYSRPGNII